MVTGIADKRGAFILPAEFLLVVRAALDTASAGALALTFSFKTLRPALGDPGADIMVDTVIAF